MHFVIPALVGAVICFLGLYVIGFIAWLDKITDGWLDKITDGWSATVIITWGALAAIVVAVILGGH